MNEFKGTPGPWSLSEGWIDKHVSVDAKEHGAIALVLSDMESDYTFSEAKRTAKRLELSANAHLIAAAPGLLKALMDISRGRVDVDEVNAAIRKALGEGK
ncbi:hypothetical protein NPT98_004508 [Salmonella enterica]|nr:hypothetical protein [Salmonella enterica]EJN3045465.1 hypothetical protein [Salmonella enterica]